MSRTKAHWPQTLHAAAIATMVAGYPLVAGISTLTSYDNSTLSLVMRAMVAGATLFLLIFASSNLQHDKLANWALAAGLVFWAIYFPRLAYETTYYGISLNVPPSSYWLWAIGGCFVPFVGFARVVCTDGDGGRHMIWMRWSIIAALAVVLPNASTVVEVDTGLADIGRLGLQALNPISMGHLGVSALLLAFWAAFARRGSTTLSNIAFILILVVLGSVVAISANSRGPLVALFVGIGFLILTSNIRRKYWLIGIGGAGIIGFGPIVLALDNYFGTRTFERFFGQSQLEDAATLERFDLYRASIDQFWSNPFIGSGLEVNGFGSYPHNLLLEAFMTTGLIGGLGFTAMIILCVTCAWRLMRNAPGFGWLSLMYLQYLIAGQFSGAIYESSIFWSLTGALLSVSGGHRYSVNTINRSHAKLDRVTALAG